MSVPLSIIKQATAVFESAPSGLSVEERMRAALQAIWPMPRCPQCGDEATYQTTDGRLWDGNAHSWRV